MREITKAKNFFLYHRLNLQQKIKVLKTFFCDGKCTRKEKMMNDEMDAQLFTGAVDDEKLLAEV
jgi:hypothetical protein